MEDMQNQMNAILENPEMMQKIMTMAQSLNNASGSEPEKAVSGQENPGFSLSDIDLNMVKQLSGLAGQSNIDNNQRSLLKALTPYLSRERVSKLERAMRAAKMASLASSLLSRSGISFLSGR